MADTLISDKNIHFGITDTGTLGFFESLEWEEQSGKTEVSDGDGDIIGIDYFGKKTVCNGVFVLDTNGTIPGVGTAITLTDSPEKINGGDNGTLYVDTIKETKVNDDVTKVEFTATSYPNIS